MTIERGKRLKTCGVVGLGYVGLPLAVQAARAGFAVYGVDSSEEKVRRLGLGESVVPDVPSSDLTEVLASGSLTVTADFSCLRNADAVVICVPTPLRKSRDPDLSYVLAAVRSFKPFLRPGQLVVLESTVYPGATEELIRPELEQGGLRAGRDFFLAISPERIDPGSCRWGLANTPKVVGGVTPACTARAVEFYARLVERVVPVSSARVAEMVKLLENVFRAVNIALANETAIICERMGVDVWEVVEAAATKPFGFMPFYPGPGIGGHCIPVDPVYLSWKAKTMGYHHRLIELATDINAEMPAWWWPGSAKSLTCGPRPCGARESSSSSAWPISRMWATYGSRRPWRSYTSCGSGGAGRLPRPLRSLPQRFRHNPCIGAAYRRAAVCVRFGCSHYEPFLLRLSLD